MLHLFLRVKGEHIDTVYLNREYTPDELKSLIKKNCAHLSPEEQAFILEQGKILQEDELVLKAEEDVQISCGYPDLVEIAQKKDEIQIFPWAWYHVEKHKPFLEKVKDFILL